MEWSWGACNSSCEHHKCKEKKVRCPHIPESTPRIHNIDDDDELVTPYYELRLSNMGRAIERFAVNIFQLSSTHVSQPADSVCGNVTIRRKKREMAFRRRSIRSVFPWLEKKLTWNKDMNQRDTKKVGNEQKYGV
ncbi:hypothetical protein RIR_jg33382.t1 [Rhizophagus irregularis DAOM 181602=DAOM 197198]|nr:hypothetical protein RIR_jg33382.t1 [Rhizophagus irregularis DAOM 181602=DAOM 197198]